MQSELDILKKENSALLARLVRKNKKIERLEEEIRLHTLARFGRKSEVYENPNQPGFFNEIESDSPQGQTKSEEDLEETMVGPYTKKRGYRKPLPDFLPRQCIEHDLSEEEKYCSVHNLALVKKTSQKN
jgi:hypothetical protein